MTRRLATVPQLVDALAAEGWGDLADAEHRAMRSVLETLAKLGRDSGRVVITGWQLAQRAGYCEKWTRKALTRLEAMNLVKWTRGAIVAGKPTPGVIQVCRSRLRQFVEHAAQLRRWATKLHRAETADRIRTTVRNSDLRSKKQRPRKQNPLSTQPELASILPPYRGQGTDAEGDPGTGEPMKQPCIHATPNINECGMCRRELRLNPDMDVRTLYAPEEKPPATEQARIGWRERVRRAALAQQNNQEPIL